MDVALFATAYFPTIEYFLLLMRFDAVCIEAQEHFVKQSNRSRMHILSPNGVQTISIPIVQTHKKTLTSDVEIDLSTNWKQQHWRSITTAYNRSAFFEFYADRLEDVFFEDEKNLLKFNTQLTKQLLEIVQHKSEITFSKTFERVIVENDYRNISNKKNTFTDLKLKEYPQVFSSKFTFQKNLSVLDLIFNCGGKFVV